MGMNSDRILRKMQQATRQILNEGKSWWKCPGCGSRNSTSPEIGNCPACGTRMPIFNNAQVQASVADANAAAAMHEPMSGVHSHPHAAFGAGDSVDGFHAHNHRHYNDNEHAHFH